MEPWRASTLTKGDILHMPEIGIEIPVTEFYEEITFPEEGERLNHASPLNPHGQ